MRAHPGVGIVTILIVVVLIGSANSAPAGKTLVMAVGGTTASLNPHAAASTPSVAVFLQVFEGLTRFDDRGKLEPALATSWRAVDATTWEFKLRSGVRFHSGHTLSAEDVKFSVEQVFRPELRSVQRTRIALVERVEVVDPLTVRFVTSRPFPILPAQLAIIFIASRQYFAERGEAYVADHPVGTGPFRFVSWRPGGERFEFEAFDQYWGGRPKIDRLVIRQIPEGATRVSALLAGEAHIANNLPIDLAETVNKTAGFRVISGFLGNGLIIGFNIWQKGPLQNAKVRQALRYAVDREAILRDLLKGQGRILNEQVLTPEAFGYNAELRPLPYDPARAKALLAEAGYPDGFRITLSTPQGRYLMDKEIATAVAAQLSAVGVQTDVRAMDLGTFVRGLTDGSFQMFLVGWQNSPNFDADTALQWFQSTSVYRWAGDKMADRLILEARTTADPAKRRALYKRVTEYMHTTQHPAIFLFQTKLLYGLAGAVQGFVARPDEYYNFRSVDLR
jgi:peptide/nickel transport system substrate-binding protein